MHDPLDDLFSPSSDKERKRVRKMRLPVFPMAGTLMVSLFMVLLTGTIGLMLPGDILNQDPDFMTEDDNEKTLIEKTLHYCRPNMLQALAAGFDRGTCREKLRYMSHFIADRDRGESPELNEDILSDISDNKSRMLERVRRHTSGFISVAR